jgi:hypothetical protein
MRQQEIRQFMRPQPQQRDAKIEQLQSEEGMAIITVSDDDDAESEHRESPAVESGSSVAVDDTADVCNSGSDVPDSSRVSNPLRFAGEHGVFPCPLPSPLQDRPEHEFLTDTGYLWNAVPPRSSKYMDLEAEHSGSTSSGSTGSSDGSLSDDFVVKDSPAVRKRHLPLLQKMFPKTFNGRAYRRK